MFVFLILIVLTGCALFAINTYNGLRRRSESVKRASSDMQGELRKRATVVNQLIDICKGFGDHEKLTQITVAGQTASMAENSIGIPSTNTVIERVAAFAAHFPELKANETYVKLMGQIEQIENLLQQKRETYNRAVEDYNTTRASFPTVLFSDKWGFPEAPYFKTDDAGLDEIAEFRTDDGSLLRDQMNRIGVAAGEAGKKLATQTGKAIEQVRERVGRDSNEPMGAGAPAKPVEAGTGADGRAD